MECITTSDDALKEFWNTYTSEKCVPCMFIDMIVGKDYFTRGTLLFSVQSTPLRIHHRLSPDEMGTHIYFVQPK